MSRFILSGLVFAAMLLFSCQRPASVPAKQSLFTGQDIDFAASLQTIAIGSCNRQDLPQTIWPVIASNNPDIWIWLGDNIYADTEDMEAMRQMYLQQKFNPDYAAFRDKTPVFGIWDDHDYGVNDGGKEFEPKGASRDLMLDFLDVPTDAAVRQRAGGYQSYTFGPEGKQVKLILLDGRYFRDALKENPDKTTRYLKNETGDILGEAQWDWLAAELDSSNANIHLIACGIQMLAEEQVFEKWANFPAARQRLLDLLTEKRPGNTLLLSGDRHISELATLEIPGWENMLYEVTSSGLTHAYEGVGEEPNQYRLGPLVKQKSFALLKIDWSAPQPALNIVFKATDNSTIFDYRIVLQNLNNN